MVVAMVVVVVVVVDVVIIVVFVVVEGVAVGVCVVSIVSVVVSRACVVSGTGVCGLVSVVLMVRGDDVIVIVGGSELASVVGGEDEVRVLCVVWLLMSTSPLQRLEVQVQAYEEESTG